MSPHDAIWRSALLHPRFKRLDGVKQAIFGSLAHVLRIDASCPAKVPYLAARYAIIDEMGFIAGREVPLLTWFRRIYWDTTSSEWSYSPHAAGRSGSQSSSVWYRLSVPAPKPGGELQTTDLAES